MGKRELEVFGKELLDVGALDVFGLLELDDLEDLFAARLAKPLSCGFRICYIRGLNGIETDVSRPCLGTKPPQRRFLTSHGTPCTCCGYRSGSRIGSRYRSS